MESLNQIQLEPTRPQKQEQKPTGLVFLSKRCFHTNHAGITEWSADARENLRRVMAAAYRYQRGQRKSSGETPLQKEEEM